MLPGFFEMLKKIRDIIEKSFDLSLYIFTRRAIL